MVMPVAAATQPIISNSLAIRQEIQRFESVHPSIYAIYDLIDLLPIADSQIAQQIRDHVVCIEGKLIIFLPAHNARLDKPNNVPLKTIQMK